LRTNQHLTAAAMLAAAAVALGTVGVGTAYAQEAQPTAPVDATPASPQPEPAAPTPAPNYNVQTAGLIDGYYEYQFNNPKSATIAGRPYDFRHNTPTLSLAELNVFKVAKPGGFGFKATLGAGDTADINGGGNALYEGRYKAFLQGYGTYSFDGGAGIDFGKFYTPFGYEVTESNANFNYTHSKAFDLVPFYHSGIRIYTPNMNGLTGTVYVVRSLYNTATAGVADDNKDLAFIGSVNYTDPKGKFVFIESIGGGKDKFNLATGDTSGQVSAFGDVENKVLVSDTDFTYNLDASHIVALNYTYAKTDPDGNSSGVTKATAQGWAAYYKQILTPKTAFAVRYSGNEVKVDGASEKSKPWEATATYEIKPAANFTTRIEYRHDGSNFESFGDSDGNATKKSQDTLLVAGMFTF